MSTRGVIGLVFAAVVATGLAASSADAKNLNLQNQNHVGHCDVAGNCRPGRTGTSQPTTSPPHGHPGSVGSLGAGAGQISGAHRDGGGVGGGRRR